MAYKEEIIIYCEEISIRLLFEYFPSQYHKSWSVLKVKYREFDFYTILQGYRRLQLYGEPSGKAVEKFQCQDSSSSKPGLYLQLYKSNSPCIKNLFPMPPLKLGLFSAAV